MVFEPKYTQVVSSTRRRLGTTQTNIEFKLPIEENVVALYSVSGNSAITTSEVAGSNINYSGLLDVQVCYDGGTILATDYNAEFRDKFVSDTDIEGEVVTASNVVDVSATIVSGGLRVSAIVEVYFDVIDSVEMNVLTGINDDTAYTSTKSVEYSRYLGRAHEKFDIDGEIEIKNAQKILMVTPNVCVKNVEARDDYAVVTGGLNVSICYLGGNTAQDIMTMNSIIDFSWEVAYADIDEKSFIQSAVDIVYNEIRVSTTLEEGMATVELYVPVNYSGYVFERMCLDVVDDLYLESNYMSVTNDTLHTITGEPSVSFSDNIAGSASISDTAPFIDEILGVSTNNIVLASSRIDDDKLLIEGVANSTVAYYTKETESVTSVQVEMPFFVEERVDGDNASIVTMCLTDVVAKSRRGKEIEVSGELKVFADIYDHDSDVVITDVAMGEAKPQDECALYVYIVKPNETLWDVAKEMNVSQELILEQNPEVELPLQAGDRLIIYRPKMMEF